MSDEHGTCVAPDCGAETRTRYHRLCDACTKRVEDAMIEARPALLEAMVEARSEAEAWLAAEWSPMRRWVIADHDYHEESIDAVIARMVDETADEFGAPILGFVDDARHARWREHLPERERPPQTAWRLGSDSEAVRAWRAHLAARLKPALEDALATFPISYAGREIKDALTQEDDVGEDVVHGAFEELWEGSGPIGMSEAAQDYLAMRYYPDPSWGCDATDNLYEDHWIRYRVLPDDVMAIFEAAIALGAQDA